MLFWRMFYFRDALLRSLLYHASCGCELIQCQSMLTNACKKKKLFLYSHWCWPIHLAIGECHDGAAICLKVWLLKPWGRHKLICSFCIQEHRCAIEQDTFLKVSQMCFSPASKGSINLKHSWLYSDDHVRWRKCLFTAYQQLWYLSIQVRYVWHLTQGNVCYPEWDVKHIWPE